MPQASLFAYAHASLAAEPLTDAHGPQRLVWLHGWGQTRQSLRPLANSLNQFGEVWLVDLPGHGDAPLPPEAWSPAEYAELVAAWLRSLPPLPTVVVGHSFGFRVAVHLAAKHPALVAGLVAIAGAGVPRALGMKQRLRRGMIRALMAMGKALRPILGDGLVGHLRARFGSADYAAAGALRPTFVRVVNDNVSELCARVAVPVLLLYGTLDTETPPDVGQSFAGLLNDAELHILNGQTHHSLLQAGRHVVAELMANWLNKKTL